MIASRLGALCALVLAATASAHEVEWNQRVSFGTLERRQNSGNSFSAPEVTVEGSDCVAAFGAGYITCREKTADQIRLCYNPSIGQTCCEQQWGCPSQSFCLTKGLCCPEGLDAKTCAARYSVSLPASLPASTPPPAYSTPAPAPPVSSVQVVPVPYPAQNTTTSCPTATGTGSIPSYTVKPYEGAAASVEIVDFKLVGAWTTGLLALFAIAQLL